MRETNARLITSAASGLAVLLTGISVQAQGYMGAEWCAECHSSQAQQWRKTAHATTVERLTKAERGNMTCMACHGTAPGLANVQCEACHGPGEAYWPAKVMRRRRRARKAGLQAGNIGCIRCHTANTPTLRPFDHAAMLSLIKHSSKEER